MNVSSPARSTTVAQPTSPVVPQRALHNASAFSTATPAEIESSAAVLDALVGKKLITAKFVDPTVAESDPGRTAELSGTAAARAGEGALFDKLPDAISVSRRAASDLAGAVGLPADQLAPGQIIVKVGSHYAALLAALEQAPKLSHPLIAENEPGGAGTGWKPLAATSYTPVDPSVVAVIDGLGNLVPAESA